MILSVWLMWERGLPQHSSTWRPYVDSLPDYTFSSPFWPRDVLASMTGSPVVTNSELRVKTMGQEYETIKAAVFDRYPSIFTDSFSMHEYMKAYSVVAARFWQPQELGGQVTLVPLGDMVNHNAKSETYM
mmetsp:Transcript_33933/g.54983  ORF Transcript_33933/g.54983 Transcript_33933/m.54983 type:complete len:130 (+) Transcript_33933:480-869(+)